MIILCTSLFNHTMINQKQKLRPKSISRPNSNEQKYEYDIEYPSSSNIPFPFPSGPYPQQAALMDTMLKTLKLIDENANRKCDNGTDYSRKETERESGDGKYRANVMMLESPTGTGKSISLACASLSWLKYREEVDLAKMATEGLEINESKTEPISDGKSKEDEQTLEQGDTKTNTKTSIDWLDAWAPPEQIQREKDAKEQKKKCADLATQTRLTLEQELKLIRSQIRHEVKIHDRNRKQIAHAGVGEGAVREAVNSKDAEKKNVRNAREKIAKRDVERYNNSSRQKQYRYQHDKNRRGMNKKAKKEDSVEDDFCLAEYHSDNDVFSSHKYQHDSSDDDDDYHFRVDEDLKKNSLSEEKKKQQKKTITTKDLLDGGQLDGSNFSSHPRHMYTASRTSGYYDNEESQEESHASIGGVEPGSGVRKIVYAARTHSQLSQFVGEIRRTEWGVKDNIRVITLGGRKLLCGNKDVVGSNRNRSEACITEKCLDMQKGIRDSSSSSGTGNDSSSKNRKRTSSSRTTSSCPLLIKDALPTLAMHMLAKPSDIEDLAGLGRQSKTCSYYASREALKAAEVVVVPYNTLLSKPARESVGLSLKKSLVIIDEAHNIPEALRSLSSSKLTLPIIDGAINQLTAYVGKYADRLAGRNLFYLGQIRRFLTQAAKNLRKGQRKQGPKRSMVTATELLFTLKVDNLNLFNIIQYLEKSRLSQKLHGFNKAVQQQEKILDGHANADDPNFLSKHISPMSLVETFLKCLTSTQKEGRVVIETPCTDATTDSRASTNIIPCFRYLLLDPSNEFKNVLDEAHAVVLAGGTLRPFVHVATELFGCDPKLVHQAKTAEVDYDVSGQQLSNATISASLTTFTCGHVVPSSNVLMTCVSKGPSGTTLDFRHSSRFQDNTCDELGKSILSLASIVPNGMVVFLPSYSYEAFVIKRWKKTGVYGQITERKRIYREPLSAKDTEPTLISYSKQANSESGAILFCVVGGKMSEGINFANEMARCVFVVGLPYADITDPELKEKMQLLDQELHDTTSSSSGISGKEYYQNLCMRAVNQSIGRAIRHAKDYAAIVLADSRYASDSRVWNGLPEWLRADTKQQACSFDEISRNVQDFYRSLKR